MVYYYLTNSNQSRINIPFIPPRIKKRKMKDRFYLLNDIFGENILEQFNPICSMLIDAMKFDLPEYWDEAGEMLLGLKSDKYDRWANHCFNVSNRIRNKGNRRTRKIIPHYSSEDSVKKFRRLTGAKNAIL